MGYTLKLSVYTVPLRKKRQQDLTTFGDFLREQFSDQTGVTTPRPSLFSNFKNALLDSFSDEFQINNERTKGIALKEINSIDTLSMVDGFIIGGLTGVEQDIYDSSNSSTAEDVIRQSKVTALPYYFKLWMPFDSPLGVLMIQGYTEIGVSSLFLNQLKSFFGIYDYMFINERFVPEEYKRRFKRGSQVQQLTLLKNELNQEARRSLSSMFVNSEGLKIEVKISGFKISIGEFLENVETQNILNADLSDLGITSDNSDIIATYKDEAGLQSQARLSKNFDILPTIILDNTLKENGKEYPNYERIRQHTNTILNEIKRELEYGS